MGCHHLYNSSNSKPAERDPFTTEKLARSTANLQTFRLIAAVKLSYHWSRIRV